MAVYYVECPQYSIRLGARSAICGAPCLLRAFDVSRDSMVDRQFVTAWVRD